MRYWMSACLVMICGLALAAQSAITTIDLRALKLDRHDVQFVEADGNMATVEALAVGWDDNAYRVIAVRGAICVGPAFSPRRDPFTTVDVQRLGMRDVLVVRSLVDSTSLRIVALDVPPCP